MRILSWNCRGLGKSSTILLCQQKAHEFKPDIMFLMETKLVEGKGKEVWTRCGFLDGLEVPRVGFSGGLILAWMNIPNLKINFVSNRLIHIDLLDNKGFPIFITFVYGHPKHDRREEVWQQLSSLKASTLVMYRGL